MFDEDADLSMSACPIAGVGANPGPPLAQRGRDLPFP